MSKAKKICFIIFCILILTIFLPVLIDYHQVSDLGIQLFSWRQNHFVEFYLSRYIFWGDSGSINFSFVIDVSCVVLSQTLFGNST